MKSGTSLAAMFLAAAFARACHSTHEVPEPAPGATSGSAIAAAARSAPSTSTEQKGPPPDPRLDAVVRSQIEPEATRCYEKGLKAVPNQAGNVVLVVKIKPSGKVDTVSAGADGALSVDTVDCIQWVAKRAEFGPTPGDAGAIVRIPLTFPH